MKQYITDTVSIRQLILDLLTRQPMSGYDIKRFLKSLSWLIDSPSFGSLYPALHTLLEDGLVTVEVIPPQDKPPRKIYSITDRYRDFAGMGEATDRLGCFSEGFLDALDHGLAVVNAKLI
jgi:DNA-binding PadR family transcriptional regulator